MAGSTVATTGYYGDRLDEYDYTDYGVPVHAPVALDGRWITAMSNSGDVTTVTLKAAVLSPNELLGCELRVATNSPSTSQPLYASGWVMSHLGTSVKVHDPDGAVCDIWDALTGQNPGDGAENAKANANFYDLRQGYWQGVMDDAETDFWPKSGPWYLQPVTIITVNDGAFENWMASTSTMTRSIYFYDPSSGQWKIHYAVDFDVQVTGSGFKELAIYPPISLPSDLVGAGKWYIIPATNAPQREACQSGQWEDCATHAGGETTFTLPIWAYVSDYQVGWLLQPDINIPVYLPIKRVAGQTVIVSGNYESLVSSAIDAAHFRIHAPPGTETRGSHVTGHDAGLLSRYVSATSSRNLFCGYRYETPIAGFKDGSAIVARQSGWNFAGLHYTLNRHYDPFLMRFTSNDPAASPFFNLFAYCGNSPGGFFDPDGLERMSAEDEKYFAENAAMRQGIVNAMNLWGLFDQTKSAMRENGSVGEVASAFGNEVATKDWNTVGTSGAYNYWNTMWGGWAGEIVSPEQAASATGANVYSPEWEQGAGFGTVAAGVVLLGVPGPARIGTGLATMAHGVLDATRGHGITANLQVAAGGGLTLSGLRGLPRKTNPAGPSKRLGVTSQMRAKHKRPELSATNSTPIQRRLKWQSPVFTRESISTGRIARHLASLGFQCVGRT